MAFLTYLPQHKTFALICTFHEKDIPKANGFRWDSGLKLWVEPNPARAYRLIHYARPETAKILKESVGVVESASLPQVEIKSPIEGELMRHQKEAVEFILNRKHSYYAGDPGIGKTLTAITAIESKGYRQNLIVCPPFLALNWQREIKKWAGVDSVIVTNGRFDVETCDSPYIICPDSLLIRPAIYAGLMTHEFDFLVLDEAHRFKNEETKRTQSVFGKDAGRNQIKGITERAKHVVCLSGTPMPNRPVELWPMIKGLAHWAIGGRSFFEFVMRYCGAYKDEWGWNFSGSSNVQELREKLIGPFMLRHEKMDFLDLPPKVVRLVELDVDTAIKKEIKELSNLTDADIEAISESNFQKLGDIAKIRQKVGVSKVLACGEILNSALEESGKIVVFGYHKAVITLLEQHFASLGVKAVKIDGSVPSQDRQALIDQFQTDPETKVFIGQIQAAGVGITLTASRRVIFVESSWVPAENEQAEDRCHRIGASGTVLVDRLVYPHDLDYRILKSNTLKTKTINKLLKGVTNGNK